MWLRDKLFRKKEKSFGSDSTNLGQEMRGGRSSSADSRELSLELLKAAYGESGEATTRVRALLAQGAHVDVVDEEVETPLMKAAWAGNIETIKLLVAAGSPIDSRNWEGKTSLMATAISGNTAALDVLIQAGADLEVRCDSGCTAYYYARLTGHHEAAQLLRRAGARS